MSHRPKQNQANIINPNESRADGNSLIASQDIHLNTGQEHHSTVQNTKTHSGGLFSSTTTTTHDAVQDSYAIGSLLSGNTLMVTAGHDLTMQAAQIVATDDVVMAAAVNEMDGEPDINASKVLTLAQVNAITMGAMSRCR